MVGCKDYHYRFHYPGWLFRGGGGGGSMGWRGGGTQRWRVVACRKLWQFLLFRSCGTAGGARCDFINSPALYNPLGFLQKQLSWISKDVGCPETRHWIITTMWNSQTSSKPSALICQPRVSGASGFHPRGFAPHMEAKIRWDLTQTPRFHLILK